MFTTLLSLGVASLVFLGLFSLFGAIAAIIPAVLAMLGAFFLISRKMAKNIEFQMKDLQNDLMKGQIEKAINLLLDIKKRYARWQFFLGATIDGQIGSIYYMKNQHPKAKPYLEKAFVRHWVAKAMLAMIYYRERKYDKMNKVFEHTTRYVKNTGLLWSLWAYCAWRNGDIPKAISILSKGKSILKDSDPYLSQNLLSLQNDKKMKMKGYGDQWYQFQLELSPAQNQMRQGRVQFRSR